MWKQSDILYDVTDMAPQLDRLPIGGWFAVYKNLSASGHRQAVYKFQSCGFATAASAEQYESFTTPNSQIQLVDY
jgi:hypothetical protein